MSDPKASPASPLTHFDAQGQAHMVDVAAKAHTHRIAVAEGRITMQPATLALIQSGTAKKGDVLGIARIAGIQGAKKTSDLIPLCHPIPLTRVALDFELDGQTVGIPTGFAFYLKALHGFVAAENILDGPGHHMMDSRNAVG